MEDMLSYMIARDTMHQNQWHAAVDSLGEHLPVPASFPREKENQEYSYTFMSTFAEERPDPETPWTQGESPDGKGEFSYGRQPGNGFADVEEMIDEMHNEVN